VTRLLLAALIVIVLTPMRGFAQEPVRRFAQEPMGRFPQEAVGRSGEAEAVAPAARDRLHALAERFRPLHERLRQDDRVRTAGSVLGFGVVAYEAFQRRPHLPLTLVGTQALRLGLHRQLSTIRSRTGFVVEPSVAQGGFAITFRRTFE
jgi:hypothetical protein